MAKRELLSPANDTASKAIVDTQTATTRVKAIITECVSQGVSDEELTKRLNKAIAEECKRIPNAGFREQFRKALVTSARKWHYELRETYRISEENLRREAMRQPLNIELQNLLGKTPYQKQLEFRKLLDDGTNPGIPVIKEYQSNVKLAVKALSAEPPKIVTTKNGKAYVMPVRLRAELAVRYAAAVENLQRLIDDGVLFCWISSHANCSPRCRQYQGKLYSLFQGKTTINGQEYGESGTIDGIPYRPINEALSGANNDGNGCISGYGCRHRAIEYEKGSRPPEDFSKAEMEREYAVDKQQRAYENRIRQLKQEEKQLRACGMDKEASAKRKQWRRLTKDYQIYSIEHDRAYYPYRYLIDREEKAELHKGVTSLAQNEGNDIPPPYDRGTIDSDTYKEKFVGLGGKRVISTTIKESRRCIRLNDKTRSERGVFIDTSGKSVFSFTGENSSADYRRFNFSKHKENSLVLVHNHPSGGSFSADDILTISDNQQIKTIVAAGHNGTVYQLSIGDGKRVDKEIYSEYNKTMEKFSYDSHKTLEWLSKKYGWRYKKL